MLASLLLGLRELRAPLAAGYVWLLGLWLTLLALPAAADYSTALYRHLVDLANWAGKPVWFCLCPAPIAEPLHIHHQDGPVHR